ncbi:MAG: Kelch repeat-containing protein, partial [Polyangiales bacterium]
ALHLDLGSTLARFPSLGLRRDLHASVVAAEGGLGVVGAPYRARLPARASGVLHLERDARPDLSLDVSLLGEDVAGVVDGAGVVYANAAKSTDIALLPVEGGLEDLRILGDANAPAHFEYAIEKGASIASLVKRGGHLIALDREGIVRFSMHAPFAVDAEGTRRSLDLRVDDGPVAHVRVSVDTRGLRFPIAIDPLWSVSAASTYTYAGHMFGHMPGNAVMLATGSDREEKLDLGTNTWSLLSGPSQFNDQLNWTELAPGKFLVYSGYVSSEVLNTWIWQPGAPAVAGPPTKFPRAYAPPAVTLSANAILVAGGMVNVGTGSATSVSTSEVYDSVANTWTAAGAMSTPRYDFGLVALPGGKALAVGGRPSYFTSSTYYSTAEIFDPTSKTWSSTAPMKRARYRFLAVALSSGKVLVSGGLQLDSTAELYDPTSKTWSDVGSMSSYHDSGSVVSLGSDRALVIGGDSTAEVYDNATKTWARASDLPTDRRGAIPLVVSGKALFGGGFSDLDGPADTVLTYSPTAVAGACARDGDCASLHCVDGVCCSTACNGPCQVCDAAGSKGTCTGVSGLPHTGHPSCAPFLTCTAGACATSCSGPSDCATGAFCTGGVCIPQKANGAACSTALDCLSGNCADGVCCNAPCDGSCEACAESGSVGTCIAVSGAPRGARAACTGTGACASRCDGTTRKICTFPPKTAVCSSDACASGVETHKRTCDGVGHCNDVPKTCGAFACGGVTCKTTCATGADCASGFICKSAACIPAPGLGEPCDATKPCVGALSCTDGVCCGVAACETGKSCGLPTTRGICAKTDGQSCTTDGECGSGTCTDGVCCESACAGQCQACDVAGSVGKCVAVKGAPHGARVACSTGTSTCEATSCDGIDGSTCLAHVGSDVSCRAESCTDAIRTEPGSCDGAGKCPEPVKTSCSPFGCAGTACATSCTTAGDCAAGFLCHAGSCESPKADCSPDLRSIVDGAGRSASCAPFLCRDGACLSSCTTSDDCAPGTLCNTGACVAAPIAAQDTSSGCAFGGRSRTASMLGLLAVALLVSRRRASHR